jgi:hypothetical protein
MTYLQLERIERLLHLDFDEIDDSVHALIRCMLDHVVEAMLKDEAIATAGLSRRDLRVLADAHFECVDELIRHGFYSRHGAPEPPVETKPPPPREAEP